MGHFCLYFIAFNWLFLQSVKMPIASCIQCRLHRTSTNVLCVLYILVVSTVVELTSVVLTFLSLNSFGVTFDLFQQWLLTNFVSVTLFRLTNTDWLIDFWQISRVYYVSLCYCCDIHFYACGYIKLFNLNFVVSWYQLRDVSYAELLTLNHLKHFRLAR